MTYWAHSDPDDLPPEDPRAKWQLLSEHLERVGALAAGMAHHARPGDQQFRMVAELAGRLHDFGKYSDCFQNMILTGKGKCPHSAHGAAIAFDTGNPDVAYAIAGHHGGIPDYGTGTGKLLTRLRDARDEAASLHSRAARDLPILASAYAPSLQPRNVPSTQFDLHTRMLFSCLVDADRLDSAGRRPDFAPLDAEVRLRMLLHAIESIAAAKEEGIVKSSRREVLDNCLAAAAFPEKLLSLTVPTGGGKTLAAMAFALRRAASFPELYRRIVVVIPYLSIIEQNAEVYSGIFGRDAILEHHSGSFDPLRSVDRDHFVPAQDSQKEDRYTPESHRLATENWDAPVIVTTSVRFFESLFSNRPADLRRVHNIARSIVILDEVQTLPRRLLGPLLSMIRELSEQWGCTFVFSTATQPAFQKPAGSSPQDMRWPAGTVREIVHDTHRLHAGLRRVVVEWELDRTISWPLLASRLAAESSVLCVVNLRDHASALFDELRNIVTHQELDSVFHLSTRMCAAHRLDALAEIKGRLDRRLPCRVVSTQLVEAGVDLDFAVAFRASGPLDAVLQAAGRADREGRLTRSLGAPAGKLVVFLPEDHRTPPNDYSEATKRTEALAKAVLLEGSSIQPHSLDYMEIYWNRYYGDGCDQGQQLQDHRQHANFATLADSFEMISNRTRDVFVPYDESAKEAIAEIRRIGQVTKDLRRRLQRYTVGLQPYEFDKARDVLETLGKSDDCWAVTDLAYTREKGLKFSLTVEDNIL